MAAAKRTAGAEEWWPTLLKRDEFEHSLNSGSRSITPPCQNLGPAKDERKALRIRPRAGGQRRRRQQPRDPAPPPGRLLRATRSYWCIKTSVHWVLDVSFREDESQVRTGNAPENFAIIRRMARTLLRQDRTSKISIRGNANWLTGAMTTCSLSSPVRKCLPWIPNQSQGEMRRVMR